MPVLFVHGRLDPVPVRAATGAAALIPGARVEVVEGSGHFPWIEAPGSVRGPVRALLDGA